MISLDKLILKNEDPVNEFNLDIQNTIDLRLKLFAPDDEDQVFLIHIHESSKAILKLHLHHQDDISKFGILR